MRIVGIAIAGLSIAGLFAGLVWRHHIDRIACEIDCDLPGTEVFLRDRCLGVVPLRLTAGTIEALHLAIPKDPEAHWDPFGEGVFFGTKDLDETKVMLRAPDSCAGCYQAIDSPWGRRTVLQGGGFGGSPYLMRVTLRPREEKAELGFEITPPVDFHPGQPCSIDLVCRNTCGLRMRTAAPVVCIRWGTNDTPWRKRHCELHALPASWGTLIPGAQLECNLNIVAPTCSGDYTIFAQLDDYRSEAATGYQGSIYSDFKLLRVR